MDREQKLQREGNSWLASKLIGLITLYQKQISPQRKPCCRFTPTCSCYAKTALAHHGVVKGLALSLWRLLRCQPLCKGGYDPVPQKRQGTVSGTLRETQ